MKKDMVAFFGHLFNSNDPWRLKSGLIFIICMLSGTLYTSGQTVVKASGFGVKPNSFENAAPAIRKAIEACKASGDSDLSITSWRIDVWPEGVVDRELYISNCTENDTLSKVKHIAFAFENCRNITLDG